MLNNEQESREEVNLFSAIFGDDIMKASILQHLGCHVTIG